ncbi:MAG: HAMP domain-containing sensor histidine kinase [Bacteroidota bacterium]
MEWVINGGMTKKLLHTTLKYYISYSLIVMLLAIPLFFFTTQALNLHETDEALMLEKQEFVSFYAPQLKENEIAIFNKLKGDLKIEKEDGKLFKDTFFNTYYYNSLEHENEPYRVLKCPVIINNKQYVFTAKTNLVNATDSILSVLILFIVIISTLFVGLFIITKRLSIKIWRPFYETLEQIEQFEIDKKPVINTTSTSVEEFNRLNQAINKLTKKNTLIYKSQKEFIENAAHELQTPIAIFKGKLETLIQRHDITEGQFKILEKLNDATTRLNKLNKNLLLLSKIESKYFGKSQTSINKIINNQLDFFKEQAVAKKITINIELESNIIVNTDTFLLDVLISNLFLNAINHNVENGHITVKLDKKSLLFSNSGALQALETDKMFERFSKANPSFKGNGLGLSIIKKIAENNDWEIIYCFKNNLHHFELQF